MDRFVSSSLIPLLLLGQSLGVPHAHAGIPDPGHVAARPHLHLLGGDLDAHPDHHGHADDHATAVDEHLHNMIWDTDPIDHDSEAIFVGDTHLFHRAKPANVTGGLDFWVASDLPGKALRSANRGWKNRRDPNKNGGFRIVAIPK